MGNNPWAGDNSSIISNLLKKNSRTFKDLIIFQGLSRPGFFLTNSRTFQDFQGPWGPCIKIDITSLKAEFCRRYNYLKNIITSRRRAFAQNVEFLLHSWWCLLHNSAVCTHSYLHWYRARFYHSNFNISFHDKVYIY